MQTVEDILMAKGPDVIVTDSRTTVVEAVKMMAQANVGSIIIREAGEILGIFTERDLLRRVVGAGKDPASTLVPEVMSSPIKSCRLADDIRVCGEQMLRLHIRHMAVVEEGVLVGLIGLRDTLTVVFGDAADKTVAG